MPATTEFTSPVDLFLRFLSTTGVDVSAPEKQNIVESLREGQFAQLLSTAVNDYLAHVEGKIAIFYAGNLPDGSAALLSARNLQSAFPNRYYLAEDTGRNFSLDQARGNIKANYLINSLSQELKDSVEYAIDQMADTMLSEHVGAEATRAIAILGDTRPDNNFDVSEVPRLPDSIGFGGQSVAGKTTAEISATARATSQAVMNLADDLAAAASRNGGDTVTAIDVLGKVDLFGAYDAATGTLDGYDADLWKTLSLDGMEALASGADSSVTGLASDPLAKKPFIDNILRPLAEYSGAATASWADTLSIAGLSSAGGLLLGGFAATGVANVVVTHEQTGSWSAAIAEAAVQGAGLLASTIVFGGTALVLTTVVGIPAVAVGTIGLGIGLAAVAKEVEHLQSRIDAFNHQGTPAPKTTVTTSVQPNPPSGLPGQSIQAFNQDIVLGSIGNDLIQAYNAQKIDAGSGDDFIQSQTPTTGTLASQSTTDIVAGDGNDRVVASGQVVVDAGAGDDIVALAVATAEAGTALTNVIDGGSGVDMIQYVPDGSRDDAGIQLALAVIDNPVQAAGVPRKIASVSVQTTEAHGNRTDLLSSVEIVSLSDQNDVVALSGEATKLDGPLVIDGAAQGGADDPDNAGPGDTLDFSGFSNQCIWMRCARPRSTDFSVQARDQLSNSTATTVRSCSSANGCSICSFQRRERWPARASTTAPACGSPISRTSSARPTTMS